jgi:hypothetical protein
MNRTNVIEDLTLLPLPPWWLNPWVLSVAFLLLAGLVAAGVWLARRWQARTPVAAPRPAGPPPHLEFLRLLAELRARRPGLAAYPLAIAVSEILRGYLQARYQLPSLFLTTREFLASAIQRPELDPAARTGLEEFLGQCDLVKFARGEATEAELDALLDTAERFIRAGAGEANRPAQPAAPTAAP